MPNKNLKYAQTSLSVDIYMKSGYFSGNKCYFEGRFLCHIQTCLCVVKIKTSSSRTQLLVSKNIKIFHICPSFFQNVYLQPRLHVFFFLIISLLMAWLSPSVTGVLIKHKLKISRKSPRIRTNHTLCVKGWYQSSSWLANSLYSCLIFLKWRPILGNS